MYQEVLNCVLGCTRKYYAPAGMRPLFVLIFFKLKRHGTVKCRVTTGIGLTAVRPTRDTRPLVWNTYGCNSIQYEKRTSQHTPQFSYQRRAVQRRPLKAPKSCAARKLDSIQAPPLLFSTYTKARPTPPRLWTNITQNQPTHALVQLPKAS